MLTYIPHLQKAGVILMQIGRKSTEDSSMSDMNINLFLQCEKTYFTCCEGYSEQPHNTTHHSFFPLFQYYCIPLPFSKLSRLVIKTD